MDLYIFEHNGNKVNEEIKLTYICGDNVVESIIGNIYNLVDYINYNIEGPAKVKFVNFIGNKINFIVSAITRYKTIISNEEYYSIVIKNKKRIRGR